MKETALTILSSVVTRVVLLLFTEIINTVWVKPLNDYKELKGLIRPITYKKKCLICKIIK